MAGGAIMKKIMGRGFGALIILFSFSIISAGMKCESTETKKANLYKPYKVTVNYNLSPDEMLKASNHRGYVGDLKKEKLTGEGIEKIDLYVIPIDKELPSGEVIDYLHNLGFEPANFAQLLALAAAYPDIKKNGIIVALGSFWFDHENDRVCPALHYENSKFMVLIQKEKHMNIVDTTWPAGYCFLAHK